MNNISKTCNLTNIYYYSRRFGSTCYLDTDGQPTCNCPAGYVGRRCEQCSYGYIGDPTYPGDYCKPGNINGDS